MQALVVDIGGTTTDIALLLEGQVTISEEGATVSNYKTAVKAADLLSIGLGGDSHITAGREQRSCIGPERVVPLAYLASQYPHVQNRLKALVQAQLGDSAPGMVGVLVLAARAGQDRTSVGLTDSPERKP